MTNDYKTCYLYDQKTGEYQGESIAQLSPLDLAEGREVYLLPDNATLLPLPECGDNQAAAWSGEAWTLIPDYRGKIYYETATRIMHKIESLGDTPAETWTDIPPTDPAAEWRDGAWVTPFALLQERKVREIRQEADAVLSWIKEDFSESEIISWSKQEAGTRALLANPDSTAEDAQFVRDLAAARGIPLSDLVSKIQARFTEYYRVMAGVIGSQQRCEDLVKLATTQEDLDAINLTTP